MKNFTIGELFGLARILELNKVERKEISSSENGVRALYLFTCEHLLPEGHRLAIDDRRGIVGIDHEGTILTEIPLNGLEIFVLTALVLSFRYTLDQPQIQNLYNLHAMKEEHVESLHNEHAVRSLHGLVRACNEKLQSLGLEIGALDGAYTLKKCIDTN